jgi:hypothetical protein
MGHIEVKVRPPRHSIKRADQTELSEMAEAHDCEDGFCTRRDVKHYKLFRRRAYEGRVTKNVKGVQENMRALQYLMEMDVVDNDSDMETATSGSLRRRHKKYREQWVYMLGLHIFNPTLIQPANPITKGWAAQYLYPHKLREAMDQLRWPMDKMKGFCATDETGTPESWRHRYRPRMVAQTMKVLYENDVPPSVLHEIWYVFDMCMMEPSNLLFSTPIGVSGPSRELKPALGFRHEWERIRIHDEKPLDDWRVVAILIAIMRVKTGLPLYFDSSWETVLDKDDRPSGETDVNAIISDASAKMSNWAQWRSTDVNWYGMALDMLDAAGNLIMEVRRVVKGLSFALLTRGLCSETYAGSNQEDMGPHWPVPKCRFIAASLILLARIRVNELEAWPERYQDATGGVKEDDIIPCAKRVHAVTTLLTSDVDEMAALYYGSYEWGKGPYMAVSAEDDAKKFKRFAFKEEDNPTHHLFVDRVYGPYHE